jgi:MinD-like ATPase involved in chromosome partitioning or flagellar assembly
MREIKPGVRGGRPLLERIGIAAPREFSPRSFSLLALRLERDLRRPGAGASILVAATDDDSIGVEATVELAWCFAEELGHRVLLVDATFDVNALSAAFQLNGSAGLADFLHAPVRSHELLEALVQPTQHERISVLPLGNDVGDHAKSERAEAIRSLVTAACDSYPFVLVQGSLQVAGSRSMAFSAQVDAALLIAVEEKTTLDQVKRGRRIMNDCGARRVALVLTNRPEARPKNGR